MTENKFAFAMGLLVSTLDLLRKRGRQSFVALIAEGSVFDVICSLRALPASQHAVVVSELLAIGNPRSEQVLSGLLEINGLKGLSFIAVAPLERRPAIAELISRLPQKGRPTDWDTQLPLAEVIASYGQQAVGSLCTADYWCLAAEAKLPELIATAAGANQQLIVDYIVGGPGFKNQLSPGGRALLTYSDEGLEVLTTALASTQGEQQSHVIVTLGRMKKNASAAAELLLAFIRNNLESTVGDVRENVTQAAYSLGDAIASRARVPVGTMEVIWNLLCTPPLADKVWNPLDLAAANVFAAIGTDALSYVERGILHSSPVVRQGAVRALAKMTRRLLNPEGAMPSRQSRLVRTFDHKTLAKITAVVSKFKPLVSDPDEHVRAVLAEELNEVLWPAASGLESVLMEASCAERSWTAANFAAALRRREDGYQLFENRLVQLLSQDGNSTAISNLLGNFAQATHVEGGANLLFLRAAERSSLANSHSDRLFALLVDPSEVVVEAVCGVFCTLSRTCAERAQDSLLILLDRGGRFAISAQMVFESKLCVA